MLIKLCVRLCLIIILPALNIAYSEASVMAGENTSAAKVHLQRWLQSNVAAYPAVIAAKAGLDAAKYRTIAAGKALYNPELEINAENAETRYRSIAIRQKIDWGDIRGARTKMAAANKIAADFELEKVRREVAVKLLTALAEYHTMFSLNVLARQAEQLMQRFAKLAKRRFKAGDLGQVELDLANLAYAQARFKLADAIARLARAKQTLVVLTGTDIIDLPDFISTFPDPQTAKQNIDQTVQQLPQIQALMANVTASREKVSVRRGEATAKPTIAFRAGKEDQSRLLGVTLSIPLQVRNNFNAEVDVASAQLLQAESESHETYRRLKARLKMATVTYALSRDAWLAWQAGAAGSLSRQIILLERLWKAGELSTTDYLVQLKQALETQASAIEQRNQMWASWSEWLIASGKIKHWLPMSARR